MTQTITPTPETRPSESAPPRAAKKKALQNASVESAEVRRALALDEETRAGVMVAFRRAGGDLDRWGATDRRRMAEALTHAEDRLELRSATRARDGVRLALRDVRRRLESEVWA